MEVTHDCRRELHNWLMIVIVCKNSTNDCGPGRASRASHRLIIIGDTCRTDLSLTGGKVAKLNQFVSAYQLANIQIFCTG